MPLLLFYSLHGERRTTMDYKYIKTGQNKDVGRDKKGISGENCWYGLHTKRHCHTDAATQQQLFFLHMQAMSKCASAHITKYMHIYIYIF